MEFRKFTKSLVVASAMTFVTAATAAAADVDIKVLGFWGNQPQIDDVDRPLWDSLSKETNGRINVKYVTLNEAGIKGGQALRFLKKGAFDIMTISVSYVSGDEPSLVAVDLPGVAFDFETLKQISDAYRPVMAERLKKFDGVLLTHWPFNPQIVFCKDKIESLDDLAGRKVRASGAPASDTLEQLSSTAVNMTGGEVYQALQRGLVDCGSTGTTYGFKNKWHEVTNYLYDLPLGGYSQVVQVANAKFWNELSSEDQALIKEKLAVAEEKLWAMAPTIHDYGVICTTGTKDCPLTGDTGAMKFIPTSKGDRAKLQGILQNTVIPIWKESCNNVFSECGARFDATIGKILAAQ
ncbi:MAG: TRAP transporter substrate-binding protein [Rhodospirillales bacterium]|nr:TRAP transporter substrate-binding protein [Rhodospirillales bacterium]